MSDEQRPDWDDFYQPPEELNKTTSGEANRTELMRPTVDSFDERLERVRSRQTVSQPMLPIRQRPSWMIWSVTLAVLLLTGGLVVLSLFLPPLSKDSPLADALDSRGSAFTALNSDKTRAEKDGFAVEVHPGDPGENFGVALQSVSPEAYRTGDVPSEQWSCPPAETLPEIVVEINAVYSLTTEGTPPERTGLHIPAAEHDLYGWYGSTWNFVPAQLSADGKTRVTDVPVLPDCLVVTEIKPSTPELTVNLDLGQTRSDAITMNRLLIRGMQPTLQGSLQGVLPADTPASPGYPVIPLISNYTSNDTVDAATVEAILRSPEMRLQHSANIAGFAEVNNYPAVALDYRGISPELHNQFSDLIKNITRVLRPQGRVLIVIVPPAVFEDGWQTGAYDWRTLGLLADELIIRLPLNPEAYLPNGEVDMMLQWAVGEVSRAKISLAVSALSVETAPENPARLVTLETAWDGLGDVAFNEGAAYIAPGGEVTAFLNTPYQTQIGLDATIQSPFVTYR
ncbi:MAG: hypothetical protein K8I82_28110, partial [Anaerolineae bacterium]|nr:hypothetical protein [Anaerolineae bacterium]